MTDPGEDKVKPAGRALPAGGTGLGRVLPIEEALSDAPNPGPIATEDDSGRPGPGDVLRVGRRLARDAAAALAFAAVIVIVGLLVLRPNNTPGIAIQPSPTASLIAAVTTSPTASLAPSASPSPIPSVSPTPTPTASPTPTPTASPTPTPTASPSPTASPTPSPTPIPTPKPTATPKPTPSICGLSNPPNPTSPPLPSGHGYVRFLVACDLDGDDNPRGELDANEGPMAGVVVTETCVGKPADKQTTAVNGTVTFQPGGGADCTYTFARSGWAATASYPSLPLPIHLASVYDGVTYIQLFMAPR